MEAPYLKHASWWWPFYYCFHLLWIHLQIIRRDNETQINEFCLHKRGILQIYQQLLRCSLLITSVRCLKFSSLVLLNISISSRYKTINLPMKYFSISFNNLIKVLEAFVKPNGITNHSYKPSFVLKVVFHSSPSLILIWWYPLFKSMLENNFYPLR